MSRVLGEDRTYTPHDLSVKRPGLLNGGEYDVEVYDGFLDSRFRSKRVFYPDREDLVTAEKERVQYRTMSVDYDLEEFLDTYDLHGEVVLESGGRERELLDTAEGTMETEFLYDWDEATNQLRRHADDTPDLAGENAGFLTDLVTTVGPDRYDSFTALAEDTTVRVTEVERRDSTPFQNTAKQ